MPAVHPEMTNWGVKGGSPQFCYLERHAENWVRKLSACLVSWWYWSVNISTYVYALILSCSLLFFAQNLSPWLERLNIKQLDCGVCARISPLCQPVTPAQLLTWTSSYSYIHKTLLRAQHLKSSSFLDSTCFSMPICKYILHLLPFLDHLLVSLITSTWSLNLLIAISGGKSRDNFCWWGLAYKWCHQWVFSGSMQPSSTYWIFRRCSLWKWLVKEEIHWR